MPFKLTKEQTLGTTDQHVVELSQVLSRGTFVHREMADAFLLLQQEAKQAGFDICIASGFRNFERQLAIWNAKFNNLRPVLDRQQQVIDMTNLTDWEKVQAILTYSALPGTSRHHWGTDIDIYDKNAVPADYQLQLVPSEYTSGPFIQLSKWIMANSTKFGFYLPYQNDNAGVAPEPWHLSYQPLSLQYQSMLQQNPQWLIDYLSTSDIGGKQAIIDNIEQILSHYVFNITPADRMI
jgi:LAS superfamily LD-carboxypeptidase LdcB